MNILNSIYKRKLLVRNRIDVRMRRKMCWVDFVSLETE